MVSTRFARHRLVPATAGRRLPHGGQRPRRTRCQPSQCGIDTDI